MKKTSLIIIALLIMSICNSYLQIVLTFSEKEVELNSDILWVFMFGLLVAWWCQIDARLHHANKGFDFGFIVYIFWPVMVPYYVLSTRGIEGILVVFGFIALYSLPIVSSLIAWTYFT